MTDLGLGSEIAITLAGIFIVNIILARITPFKYIFLTGQALLWESTLCVVFAYFCGLRGLPLIIIGSIVGGAFATLMPAFAQPVKRQITGSDDIALGHFCTFGYMFTALIAKLAGDKSKSTEDVALPKSLEFLQDTYLSVMVVMVPFYLIVAIFAGPKACAEYAGATNYIVFMFLQALQFVTGLYVLMAGVRLLLAELDPAFQGISMKLVPNSKPAVITLFILVFTESWNMVEQPILFLEKETDYPLSVFLASLNQNAVGIQSVCGLLCLLPVTFFFLYYNTELTDGLKDILWS